MAVCNIVVIDGQGGRMGKQLIERIRAEAIPATVIAIGSNSTATAAMMKGGADQGATGENAVVVNAARADVIIGPIGIVVADALLGEITPAMAVAVGRSMARKLLIPVNQCNNIIVGVPDLTVSALLSSVMEQLREILRQLK